MGSIGIPELLVLIIVIVIVITPFLFLRTLQNTIKATNPRNRTIEPAEVWLALIPVFGIIFHISHIYKISNTLKKDFKDKKMYQYKDSIFGKGNGLTYSYFSLIQFIVSCVLIYFYKTNSYESNEDFSNWLNFNNSISKGLSFFSIAILIHIIIYWNKMSKCKAILLAYKVENSNLHSDYKSDYQNSVSYSIKNNKIDELKKIKELLDEKLISQEEFDSLKSEIIGDDSVQSDTIEKTVTPPNKTVHNVHENKKECPNCKVSLPIYTKKCGSCHYSFASGIIEDGNINNTIDEIENSDVPDKHNHLIFKALAIIILITGCVLFFLHKGNNINTVQNETENIAIDSSNYNINKDSLSLNDSNNSVPIDSTENNDFDLENFEGEETYAASYVEKRCGDNYYSLDSKDVKSMSFIVSKNKLVIKGTLVDLMINSEGIPEMNVSMNSLKSKSYEDGKNARLYDVTFYYNVSGGGIGNSLGLLKIWSDGNQITDIRITTDRTSQCRFSFVTNKINDSNNNLQSNTEMPTDNIVNDNLNIEIGKYYQGGTIFYIDDTGKHGLLCSKILSSEVGNNFEEAKSLCDNYISVNFKDWYLPSLDELKLLYSQKKSVKFLKSNVHDVVSSSTKYQLWDGGNWALDFNDGGVYGVNPKSSFGVIAIRKF